MKDEREENGRKKKTVLSRSRREACFASDTQEKEKQL